MASLHVRYRPRKFLDVVGQAAVVKSLGKIIERDSSQCFLFSGPSGTGKTTLARICAVKLGCQPHDILEIDAASNTGVDDMRKVMDGLKYRPLGESDVKVLIVDECHMLSRNAWNSILKSTEEPPAHVYWFFCTTEASKIPPTIKTRATSYQLKPVPDKELGVLLDRVCEKEKIDVPGDVGDLIIREAGGSPRQLLVNLDICREAQTKKEAADLLKTALESDATIELARFMMAGGSWMKAMSIVGKLSEENPEGVRIVLVNYFGKALRDAKTDKAAAATLRILDAFAEPYNPSEKLSPLILSIGRALLGG